MNLLRTSRTKPVKPVELPPQAAGEPVLNIDHVSISYKTGSRVRSAVDDVTLQLRPGEIVALVGESGSGKTTLASALLGLLPRNGEVTKGKIEVGGLDIVGYSEHQLRAIRGSIVGLVPQDPMVSLNPTMRIGQQVGETVRLRGVPKRSVNAEVIEFLERAGLDEPIHRARQYPHELSGGIRQRALIANALAGRPKVIIADEPTSALDVTVQRRMLDHLEKLVREEQIAMLLITHDLAVASDRADRVAVMQLGKIVEQGTSAEVLTRPKHEYTQKLLSVAPGFTFRHSVEVLAEHAGADSVPTAEGEAAGAEVKAEHESVLELQDIVKDFNRRGASKGDKRVRVLDGVSFKVPAHRTLALVGESGRGKTTLMRIAMRLQAPTSGRVLFDGSDITDLSWRDLRNFRQRFQLVHQDPFSSLDPRFTIEQSITEPLISYKVGDKASRHARALELLDEVALPSTYLMRKPAELSGGQRQRVAIARALSLKPELVMLDEPVSALDVSIQAQILDLLAELQKELGVAYLFVTHDLAVVAEVAHEVAVLGPGKLAEYGPTAQVFKSPQSEETKLLIDAIPGTRLLGDPQTVLTPAAS